MKRKKFWLIFLPGLLLAAFVVLFLSARDFRAEAPGCPCSKETLSGEFISGQAEAYFDGKKLSPPLFAQETISPSEQQVLGAETGQEKWIEVSLSEQKLRAWQGNDLFLETPVSTGKRYTPTPKGEYLIQSKVKYAKMSGGSKEKGTYYYLPNVPFIMFFHNGYGLHGTYWHNNFGQVMSHGCVNLPTPMAEKLFYWTNPQTGNLKYLRASADSPGTRVVIHD
jgi:lipoprotein-anchoring transpeptidase ErfK/SrfK